jgi:hypothetical protein
VVLGDRRWTAWLAAEQQHPTWLCQLYSAPDATVYHSIIISAVLGLIDYKAAYRIRKVDKLDFLACLGGLLSLFFYLKTSTGGIIPHLILLIIALVTWLHRSLQRFSANLYMALDYIWLLFTERSKTLDQSSTTFFASLRHSGSPVIGLGFPG